MEHAIPKCQACAVPMIEGYILDRGHGFAKHVAVWVEGVPELSVFDNAQTDGHRCLQIVAFRCPECGLIQHYAHKRVYP